MCLGLTPKQNAVLPVTWNGEQMIGSYNQYSLHVARILCSGAKETTEQDLKARLSGQSCT